MATYSSDASYLGSSGTATVKVMPAPTVTQDYLTEFYPVVGQPFSIAFVTTANVPQGVAPTGTFTFYDNGIPLSGTVTTSSQGGNPSILGGISVSFNTVGEHNVTATYSGDTSYASSTSTPPLVLNAQYDETMSVSVDQSTVTIGSTVNVTAKVVTPHLTPALAGQITFNATFTPINGNVTTSLTTDGKGNQILTATVATIPQFSETIIANYTGDLDYVNGQNAVVVNVNIPDFTLGPANGVSVVPVAGQPGSGQITITPLSQTPSTVALSFSPPVISGYTIALSPQQISLNGSAATATISLTPTVTIPTNAIRSQARHAGFFAFKRGDWWLLSLATGLGVSFLLGLPGRRKRFRAALGLGLVCLLSLALGCGGGGGTGGGGGGGGGGGTPAATSIALTTSNAKVAQNESFLITATVTSKKPLTGTVTFYNFGIAFAGAFPLTNGQAQTGQGYLNNPGLYQVTATYSGDTNNLPSTSAPLTQVITGTMPVTIQGNTGGDFHYLQATLGVQ